MKKIRNPLSLLLVVVIILGICTANASASESNVLNLPSDAFLAYTGMPTSEIANMDPDIKEYIVQNLKQNARIDGLEYVDNIEEPQTRSAQSLTGISFSASAWKSGNTIHIYPTYEFTTPKKAAGSDSFAFQLSEAMRPYEFGGQVWTKLESWQDWSKYGSMVANNQSLSGAEYSGTQLGNSPFAFYAKGAAYCHADVGSGTDKRIAMTYMNNPNKGGYSINFAVKGVGVSYSSGNTIYVGSKIVKLSY